MKKSPEVVDLTKYPKNTNSSNQTDQKKNEKKDCNSTKKA